MTASTANIQPDDATSWLQHNGWRRISRNDRPASLWRRGRREVLVPERRDAVDFSVRIGELLRELSNIESRSVGELGAEISLEGVDISEWRAVGSDTGSIPLADGVQLITSARDAIVAAASARLHRKGYFGHSVPQLARDQARRVQMGQTRHGSYVVPLFSRVPEYEARHTGSQEELFDVQLASEPFERQAIYTLSTGLQALYEVTVQSDHFPSKRIVNEVVSDGVSFELATSVQKVLNGISTEELDVSFAWARRSPLAVAPPPSLVFPREVEPLLDSVVSDLRGSVIVAEQTIVAFVRQLSRGDGDAPGGGTVKLRAIAGQERRLLNASLSRENYELAAQAHLSNRAVVIRGRLRQEPGRARWFQKVSSLQMSDTLTLESDPESD